MIFVKLYGSKYDININKAIFNSLNKYGNVIVKRFDEMIFFNEFNRNFEDQYISVFKNTFKTDALSYNKLYRNSINIIDSQNKNAMNYLNQKNEITVTCGVSNKSSLMIESLTSYNAILSLQRNIKTQNELIYPQGFKIILINNIGIYPLLVTSAILLISGIPANNGYII